MEQLTSEQINNWRRILSMTLGPYALIVPDSDIQKIVNKIQNEIDAEENFISKTLSNEVDVERLPKKPTEKGTTFGNLLVEAQNNKKHTAIL